MAEMLMQSYGDTIRLLPALPKQWANEGKVQGMRAEGGFELDFQWRDAKVTQLTLRSLAGRDCHLQLPLARAAGIIADEAVEPEGWIATCTAEEGRLDFSTSADSGYALQLRDDTGIARPPYESENIKASDDQWYDLSGRQIPQSSILNHQLKRGVYIRGGKKVVVR